MSFHNTIDIEGKELIAHESRARSQEEKILEFFKKNPGRKFTPIQVLDHFGLPERRITSVRRAISNLTYAGFLLKTTQKKMERFGSKNYMWMLKPVSDGIQMSLL